MSIGDIAVIVLIAACAAAAVLHIKRKGVGCGSCSGCPSCGYCKKKDGSRA